MVKTALAEHFFARRGFGQTLITSQVGGHAFLELEVGVRGGQFF